MNTARAGNLTAALFLVLLSACQRGTTATGGTPTSSPTPSTSPSAGASPSPSPIPSPSPSVPPCTNALVEISLSSQQGAAGTIRSVWKGTNVSGADCDTFGYPGMDFHASAGWLDVQVIHGGFPDIDVAAEHLSLGAGQSLYFVSYWSDVDTGSGPCTQFGQVKVTLPDNLVSAELASSGCLDPSNVHVGPVTDTPPEP